MNSDGSLTLTEMQRQPNRMGALGVETGADRAWRELGRRLAVRTMSTPVEPRRRRLVGSEARAELERRRVVDAAEAQASATPVLDAIYRWRAVHDQRPSGPPPALLNAWMRWRNSPSEY